MESTTRPYWRYRHAASEDLLDITQPAFSTQVYDKKNVDLIVAEETRVSNAFTAAEQQWVPSQQRFAFLLAYFSGCNKQVVGRGRDWPFP